MEFVLLPLGKGRVPTRGQITLLLSIITFLDPRLKQPGNSPPTLVTLTPGAERIVNRRKLRLPLQLLLATKRQRPGLRRQQLAHHTAFAELDRTADRRELFMGRVDTKRGEQRGVDIGHGDGLIGREA